jgi:hypothetical protein
MRHHPSHRPKMTPAMEAARRMPLLRHFQPGQSFDIMESDVARWLCKQPAIRQHLFNLCKRDGSIVYEDGLWRGADWKE